METVELQEIIRQTMENRIRESKYESDLNKSTARVNSTTGLKDGVYTPDSFSWSGGTGKVSISLQQGNGYRRSGICNDHIQQSALPVCKSEWKCILSECENRKFYILCNSGRTE